MLISKLEPVWLVGGASLLTISVLLDVIERLVYPNFYSFFGLTSTPMLALGAVAIAKAFRPNWWLRLPIIIMTMMIGLWMSQVGRNWALDQLAANGFELDESVYTSYASNGAFMLASGYLIALLILFTWICGSLWISRKNKSRNTINRVDD